MQSIGSCLPGESCLDSAMSCKYLKADWLTALSFVVLIYLTFDMVNYPKFKNFRPVDEDIFFQDEVS
jgi:hypothetical protein